MSFTATEEYLDFIDSNVESESIYDSITQLEADLNLVYEAYTVIRSNSRLVRNIKIFGIKKEFIHLINKENQLGKSLKLKLPHYESLDIVNPDIDIMDIDEEIVIESLSENISLIRNWIVIQIERILKGLLELYKKFFDYYVRLEKVINKFHQSIQSVTASSYANFLGKQASLIRYFRFMSILETAITLSDQDYLKIMIEELEKNDATHIISNISSFSMTNLSTYMNAANVLLEPFGVAGRLKNFNNVFTVEFAKTEERPFIEKDTVEELGWTIDVMKVSKTKALKLIENIKKQTEKPIFINQFLRNKKLHASWENLTPEDSKKFASIVNSGFTSMILLGRQLDKQYQRLLNMYCYVFELLLKS